VSIRVERAGLLTTVQDLGRNGWQRYGVVVGGAMDSAALRIANMLVGNAETVAGLEVTLLGPTLVFERAHLFALAGADLSALLDYEPVAPGRPCAAAAGSVLTFTGARIGCRAYLAIAGGIDVPVVLGSRSTDVRARIGGCNGRAVAAGDVLPVGEPALSAEVLLRALLAQPRHVAKWGAGPSLLTRASGECVVRVLRGLEFNLFTEAHRTALFTASFQVSGQCDRMGYRLLGPRLTLDPPRELLSAPIAVGTIQVPPGGDAIVLMADRQSVGGYPRIAQVITVDLAVLAQAGPGTYVRFREATLAEAQSLYLERERHLRQLAAAIRMRSTS
jgi:antagonist of KipI